MNAFPDKPNAQPDETIEPRGEKADAREGSTEGETEGSPALPAVVPFAAEIAAPDPRLAAEFRAGPDAGFTASILEAPRDPAWTAFDVLRLVFLALVALFVGMFAVLFAAHFSIPHHPSILSLARVPLIVVAGQVVAYLLVLAYMYVLVTRERRRPDFFAAIHWNWPKNMAPYLIGGATLSCSRCSPGGVVLGQSGGREH